MGNILPNEKTVTDIKQRGYQYNTEVAWNLWKKKNRKKSARDGCDVRNDTRRCSGRQRTFFTSKRHTLLTHIVLLFFFFFYAFDLLSVWIVKRRTKYNFNVREWPTRRRCIPPLRGAKRTSSSYYSYTTTSSILPSRGRRFIIIFIWLFSRRNA